MARNEPGSASSSVFRQTDDLREARARDASFVAYLRERVGRRLRAVAECDGDRSRVEFCRSDFELDESDDGRLPDGVRIGHGCTVAVRDGTVWLSFDRRDGRVLVVVESRSSRDLSGLVADCRSALKAGEQVTQGGREMAADERAR